MAEVIVAELGTDLTRFPSAKHLASWAGLCPGKYERAGHRLSGKMRKGSRWLRQMLTEAAYAAFAANAMCLLLAIDDISAEAGARTLPDVQREHTTYAYSQRFCQWNKPAGSRRFWLGMGWGRMGCDGSFIAQRPGPHVAGHGEIGSSR